MTLNLPTPLHLIEIAIESTRKADQAKLFAPLARASQDPAFCVSHDLESGQIILKGRDKDHLDRMISALRLDNDISLGRPYVSYRERLMRRAEVDLTYRKASEFARAKFIFEPTGSSEGSRFEVADFADGIPDIYIRGIEAGLEQAMQAGVLAGFPVIDLKATLIDGAFDDARSSAKAFERCAIMACRSAFYDGGCVLLEPIMLISVSAPKTYLGAIMEDLQSRRATVIQQNVGANSVVVTAFVPFGHTFDYAHYLRSLSQGHARLTSRFSHYAPMPSAPGRDGSPVVAALRA